MNRPAFLSALGHRRIDLRRSTQCPSTRSFTLSAPRENDHDEPTRRERSAAAASELSSLNKPAPGPAVDARTFRASVPGDASSRVISIRKLRGSVNRARGPPRFGGVGRSGSPDDGGGPGSTSFRRLSQGDSESGEGFAPFRARYNDDDGRSRGARFDGRGGGRGGRGRGGRGRGGGGRSWGGRGERGERRRGRNNEGKDEEKEAADQAYAMSHEEEAYIDALEQGVVTPYNPPTDLAAELRGFGPSVATDVAGGPAESMMRSMRVLGGARPFNPTSPFAHDVKDDFARYFGERKPLFYDSLAEKAWVEGSREKFFVDPAPDVVRQAISNTSVIGKYEKPKFADLSDVSGIVAMYQAKTSTYTPQGKNMFRDTMLALMSKQTGGGQPARGQKTA